MSEAAPLPADFALYPAIDLRGGRCVRLEQGEAARETVYEADPAEQIDLYAAAGATWVHVVDLDAAFGTGSNRALIRALAERSPIRVQSGGGLRTAGDLEEVLDSGVARAVVGTAAIERPEMVRQAVERWGSERIVVGLDARGRRPAARGWTQESEADLFDLGAALCAMGVRTLIHTDIERDGTFAGPNIPLSADLADASGCDVIVSGGMRGTIDVEAIAAAVRAGRKLSGAIIGRALYEGRIDLADAIRRIAG